MLVIKPNSYHAHLIFFLKTSFCVVSSSSRANWYHHTLGENVFYEYSFNFFVTLMAITLLLCTHQYLLYSSVRLGKKVNNRIFNEILIYKSSQFLYLICSFRFFLLFVSFNLISVLCYIFFVFIINFITDNYVISCATTHKLSTQNNKRSIHRKKTWWNLIYDLTQLALDDI